ncbi:MAG TPA: hypothetical protein VGI27_11235, partial [Solirubrobacteraceae bacterium]
AFHVNATLNTAGRPIVDDPRAALECFGSAPIDLLAIGVDRAVDALARLPARAPPVPARSPLRGRTDEAANVRPDRVVANA